VGAGEEFIGTGYREYRFLGKETWVRGATIRVAYENGKVQYERLAETALFKIWS